MRRVELPEAEQGDLADLVEPRFFSAVERRLFGQIWHSVKFQSIWLFPKIGVPQNGW